MPMRATLTRICITTPGVVAKSREKCFGITFGTKHFPLLFRGNCDVMVSISEKSLEVFNRVNSHAQSRLDMISEGKLVSTVRALTNSNASELIVILEFSSQQLIYP